MKQQQAGFTLIELIAVIVILGIISAVAVPRFVDLSDAAREASVEAVAGNLASASSLNYANYVADNAGLTTNVTPAEFSDCSAHADNILDGSAPSGYTLSGDIDTSASPDPGTTFTCTVEDDDDSSVTATFEGYYVPSP